MVKPLRVLLAPFGTRGDVQPMLALAQGLTAAGHRVRFCAPPDYRSWVESHGYVFHPAGRDYASLVKELTSGAVRAFRVLSEEVPRQFAAMEPLMADVDVVVNASLEYASVTLCERLGKPHFSVLFSPCVLPSAEHPFPLIPVYGLPGWLNRLTWWLADVATRFSVLPVVNAERIRRGLRPFPPVLTEMLGPHVLLPFDAALARLARDARAGIQQMGPWLLEERDEIPADVQSFLDAGAPPVYVGFGSMPDRAPEKTTAMIVEAAGRAGVRVLLSSGWAGLGSVELPASVRVVGAVPHRKLFPRCLGVVHHGGAGTTTSSALSGVPQLVVPHEVDQFFHGRRVHHLGLGPRAIPRKKLNAPRLAEAFKAFSSADHATRARAFAREMSREGVQHAVRMIEAVSLGTPGQAPTLELRAAV
ncbi:MAG: nucleotide disphospho-sugar-binding domain-containing protein [Myxococcota bacterium]